MNRYIHVVRGDSGAGTVRTIRARHLVVLHDDLSVGPCSIDPEEHRARRYAYWCQGLEEDLADSPRLRAQCLRTLDQSVFGAGQLADALRAFPEGQPVLLWT